MSFEEIVSLVGGQANIKRVLAPESQVVISVHDHSLVGELPNGAELIEVLGEWQLSMPRTSTFLDKQLGEIGKVIASQQRLDAAERLVKTECPFRPIWHVAPPQGLLNDPNGFIYHQGQYHLFYQWYPHACAHKDKYWVHLTSGDLINWQWRSIALTPSDWYDSHGVYSGHAVSHGDELMLFYTGNVRLGEQRDRQTMQCMAVSKDGLHFEKYGPVIRELPEGVTGHFRDPKVIRHDDKWLMLIGAQTTDLQGRVAVYHSDNLKDWQYDGLAGDDIAPMGYMWECPDMFELDGQHYFVFGPQGVESSNPHHTAVHRNRIAKVMWDDKGLPRFSELQELDSGFDFYAPQSMQTEDGRRVMCGWMGLPDDVDHPSCDNGWIHQYTAIRELSIEQGQLVQRPLRELAQLRGNLIKIELGNEPVDLKTKSFEIQTTLPWGATLRLFELGEQYVDITLDAETKVLRLDRSNTLIRHGDVIRELELDSEQVVLHILSDSSSVEVFINDGQAVMTGRVFTEQNATQCRLINAKAEVEFAEMKAADAALYPL